jgi:trehalose 6-phosphate phosphatase
MSLPEPLTALGAAALEAIVRSPSETLIASDFDGTLAPIVDDPERAYADPDAVAALGRLGKHVGAVVVITGRPARMAVRLGRFREVAGLGSMIVLGQYGVERWDAAADEYRLPPNPPQIRWVSAKPESRTRVGRLQSIPARCRIRRGRSPPLPIRLLILPSGMGWS